MKILDSSVLFLFLDDISEVQCFIELSKKGEDLVIPQSVYDEVIDEKNNMIINSLISTDVIKIANNVSNIEEKYLKNRFPNLGKGEINVLAYGKSLHNRGIVYQCILDDKNARKASERLGLTLSGSIGLLNHLKNENILDKEKMAEIVSKIKSSPFRIDDTVLRRLLND